VEVIQRKDKQPSRVDSDAEITDTDTADIEEGVEGYEDRPGGTEHIEIPEKPIVPDALASVPSQPFVKRNRRRNRKNRRKGKDKNKDCEDTDLETLYSRLRREIDAKEESFIRKMARSGLRRPMVVFNCVVCRWWRFLIMLQSHINLYCFAFQYH